MFQGIVYYYRENQVLCRYQATLKEAVAPALLQQALDAARPLAEYYFCHVVWEKREARLEPNTAPCRVRQGSTQPKIPEETNDYLFSLGYEGNTVYLDWFHFLADGRGSAPFFTLLLKLYCNLRSNAGFVCEALASDPPYDVEQLLARYPESQVANDMQKDVLQIHEGTPHFQRLRLDRKSLMDLAQKEGVKPFSALMGLTCQAAQLYLEKNDLVYSYAAETVVLLSRETNPLTVEVRMEVETGEVKEHPTYKRIQEYVQEKYGFKVHTAYIAEVKRMVGLDMHKAPNAVEQRKHEYHPCPPEKVEAIKDALRHFGLISE